MMLSSMYALVLFTSEISQSIRRRQGCLSRCLCLDGYRRLCHLTILQACLKSEISGTIVTMVDLLFKYATFMAAPKYFSEEEMAKFSSSILSSTWEYKKAWRVTEIPILWEIFGWSFSSYSAHAFDMSSSNHPESDEQTKHFKCMLEEYL